MILKASAERGASSEAARVWPVESPWGGRPTIAFTSSGDGR